MPMRSGLSIYCYTAPTNQNYSNTVMEIGSLITDLSFASAAPGGFTTFSATLPLRDGRIPLPPFALFSMIAVMNGPDPVWLGEMTDPEMGMDATNGEYMRLGGLGLGNVLRDNLETVTWNSAHPFDIVADLLLSLQYAWPDCPIPTISTDNRYIFPDRPTTMFSRPMTTEAWKRLSPTCARWRVTINGAPGRIPRQNRSTPRAFAWGC